MASGSNRRLELLASVGMIPKSIFKPDIDESPRKGELPVDYVKRIALQKSLIASQKYPDELILAADTIACVGTRILGKPVDEKDARRMLNLISGRRHRVYTAFVARKKSDVKSRLVETTVRFKRLHETEIKSYIASNEWQDKAGGYAIQGLAGAFIASINGSYSNVVGLPLMEVCNVIKSFSGEIDNSV